MSLGISAKNDSNDNVISQRAIQFCSQPISGDQSATQMARADLLLNLIRAAAKNDQSQIQRTVEALAADERAKNHTLLADRLVAQLTDLNGRNGSISGTPILKSATGPLVAELTPHRRISDLVLNPDTEVTIRELIEEHLRGELLRSYGLEPRNRILLAGAPGNGKTTLAEAIANELNVSFLVVKYESVIGSYLGETAQRIAQVFETARSRRCVLFFDEFDAVAKERGDLHETGEIKRVVSSLLLQVDALPSYVIVITASNHPELLDRAVWRRFQVRLALPPPELRQIADWLQRFETRTQHKLGLTENQIRNNLGGLSFGEIEEFGNDVLRRLLLEGNKTEKQVVKERLVQWKSRFKNKS